MPSSVAARGISNPVSGGVACVAGSDGRRNGARTALTAAAAATAADSPAAALRRARKADMARERGLVSSSLVETSSPVAACACTTATSGCQQP
jgi:hypothetical protein